MQRGSVRAHLHLERALWPMASIPIRYRRCRPDGPGMVTLADS